MYRNSLVLNSYIHMYCLYSLKPKSEAGRDAVPVVVSILGELVSILPGNVKVSLGNMVRKECENKLANPSQALSKALVHFFVLMCPQGATDR
jgi:hypothetical protein